MWPNKVETPTWPFLFAILYMEFRCWSASFYCFTKWRVQSENHYRKPCVCRVPKYLPWANHRAVCRVPRDSAHGKEYIGTRQRLCLPCAPRLGPRQKTGTRQTWHVCRVPNVGHTVKMGRAGCQMHVFLFQKKDACTLELGICCTVDC